MALRILSILGKKKAPAGADKARSTALYALGGAKQPLTMRAKALDELGPKPGAPGPIGFGGGRPRLPTRPILPQGPRQPPSTGNQTAPLPSDAPPPSARGTQYTPTPLPVDGVPGYTGTVDNPLPGVGGMEDGVGRGNPLLPPAEDPEAELARARQRFEAEQRDERAAQADQLAAGKARDLMDVDARAGAAGFGLSGATAALRADVSRTRDRSDTLAEADLARRQRDEGRADRSLTAQEARLDASAGFTDIQRRVALNELEGQLDEDVDGDGKIGGEPIGGTRGDGDTSNDPKREEELKGIADSWPESYDIDPFLDENQDAGQPNEPFYGTERQKRQLEDDGFKFTSTDKEVNVGDGFVFVDQFGNYWAFGAK